MKIAEASIQSTSARKFEASKEVSQRLELFSGGDALSAADEGAFVLDIGSNSAILTGRTYLNTDTESSEDRETNIKLKLIEDFIYQMTGKRVRLKSPMLGSSSGTSGATQNTRELRAGQQRDGWGLVYEYKETTRENENLKFSSSGTITTADGRTVQFNLDFIMSREYVNNNYINIRMGDAAKVDPLVLVFGGGTPTLSKAKQAFDLNSDGQSEQISFAIDNSGFLTLDKNGDGLINDGSELFGPQSGNGFSELRTYDIDGNGWIDESDEVFSKLSVLSMREDGEKVLFKLGDLGIGAIYINETGTSFNIKDEVSQYGQMKSSSIFLRENGTAGTVHHIDLAV